MHTKQDLLGEIITREVVYYRWSDNQLNNYSFLLKAGLYLIPQYVNNWVKDCGFLIIGTVVFHCWKWKRIRLHFFMFLLWIRSRLFYSTIYSNIVGLHFSNIFKLLWFILQYFGVIKYMVANFHHPLPNPYVCNPFRNQSTTKFIKYSLKKLVYKS